MDLRPVVPQRAKGAKDHQGHNQSEQRQAEPDYLQGPRPLGNVYVEIQVVLAAHLLHQPDDLGLIARPVVRPTGGIRFRGIGPGAPPAVQFAFSIGELCNNNKI